MKPAALASIVVLLALQTSGQAAGPAQRYAGKIHIEAVSTRPDRVSGGDVLVWIRLGPDGRVERCHLRDPSWFQWPLLEAAIEGNIVADFPLCNKSFNCSYSGHDL